MRIAINHPEMFASVFQETTKVKLNRPLNGISTDTRKIEKGDLFVALKGGDSTKGFVSVDFLEALGKDGIVINISRGSVIDENSLLDALENDRI